MDFKFFRQKSNLQTQNKPPYGETYRQRGGEVKEIKPSSATKVPARQQPPPIHSSHLQRQLTSTVSRHDHPFKTQHSNRRVDYDRSRREHSQIQYGERRSSNNTSYYRRSRSRDRHHLPNISERSSWRGSSYSSSFQQGSQQSNEERWRNSRLRYQSRQTQDHRRHRIHYECAGSSHRMRDVRSDWSDERYNNRDDDKRSSRYSNQSNSHREVHSAQKYNHYQ